MSDTAVVTATGSEVAGPAPAKKRRGRQKGQKMAPRMTDIERAIFDLCVRSGKAATEVVSSDPEAIRTLVASALAGVRVDTVQARLNENVDYLRAKAGLPPRAPKS